MLLNREENINMVGFGEVRSSRSSSREQRDIKVEELKDRN